MNKWIVRLCWSSIFLVSKILLKRSLMSVSLLIWTSQATLLSISNPKKRPRRTHSTGCPCEPSWAPPIQPQPPKVLNWGVNGGINAACLLLLPSPFPSSPLLSFISRYLSNVDLSRPPLDYIPHLLFRSQQGFLSLSHCNVASLLFSWFFTRSL